MTRARPRAVRVSFLATVLAAPLCATADSFDIATFEPPPGWQRESAAGQLTYRSGAGDARIVLLPSTPSETSAAVDFMMAYSKIAPQLGNLDRPRITAQQTPGGGSTAIGVSQITKGEDAGLSVVQVTMTGGGRTMTAFAVFGGEQSAAVTTFFDGLELHSEVALSASGPAAPPGTVAIPEARFERGKPLGLFYRVAFRTSGGSRAELRTLLFLPPNRVSRTFPLGGASAFDPSRCLPETCGTYEVAADSLTIFWDDGRMDRWQFSAVADVLLLDREFFRPARTLPADVLVGRWVDTAHDGGVGASVFEFRGDGTFVFAAGASRLDGRYSVQGLALVLEPAGGERRVRTLLGVSDGEPVRLIGVDDEVYLRRTP